MAATPRGFKADGTIPVCRFVHQGTGEYQVALADGSKPIIGVSQEGGKYAPIPGITTDPPSAAEDGDNLNVYTDGYDALVEAGAAITVGTRVKSDANGKATPITQTAGTKEFVAGVARQAAGGSGTLILVHIRPQTLTTET